MARGKGITPDEDGVIRIGLQQGKRVVEIAEYLGRSRMAIYKRIDRMEASGEIEKSDLGSNNE